MDARKHIKCLLFFPAVYEWFEDTSRDTIIVLSRNKTSNREGKLNDRIIENKKNSTPSNRDPNIHKNSDKHRSFRHFFFIKKRTNKQ